MEKKEVICIKYDNCLFIGCDHMQSHEYCGHDCDILCLSGKCNCKPVVIIDRKKKLQKISKLK
jgi:hypothetical protein